MSCDHQDTLIYFNTSWLAILLRVTDSRAGARLCEPQQRIQSKMRSIDYPRHAQPLEPSSSSRSSRDIFLIAIPRLKPRSFFQRGKRRDLRLKFRRMDSASAPTDSFTPSQRQAIAARGNVLVLAGAGTGKTKTLVARCLDCLDRDRTRLDELLIVTFTEAAAAEMRLRLRLELEKKMAASPGDDYWPHQFALFDVAHIGTLHGFCLKLVREHFHELGLDPQLAMLDEGETRQLADEILDEQFKSHYEGEDEFSRAVQNLIQIQGNGRDEKIRALVLRLHHYSQARPDASGWLGEQLQQFSAAEPMAWQMWLLTAIGHWRDEWLPVLENLQSDHEKIAELTGMVRRLGKSFTREIAAEVLAQVMSADGGWPKRNSPRKSLEDFLDEAKFLGSLAVVKGGTDPLAEDWNWIRGPMATLLRLAQEFAQKFSGRKRADGVLDFHDLEQFALKLLWNFETQQPTAIAEFWRGQLRFVFVDEYQDINAAQDKIVAALAREGADANRFLVGDVKQSIYRFRLADPKIFRDYAKSWQGANGQTIQLSENFRSRESLLNFANSVFRLVMRGEIGGVEYDDEAALKFGSRPTREALSTAGDPVPRTELLLRRKTKPDEAVTDDENGDFAALEESGKEARLIARHLKKLAGENHLIWDEDKKILRPVQFGDMAVLLRSPRGQAEAFAKEFERAGVPLSIAQGGFYDSSEIQDLISLLELLDNPLQDLPCIAVLRSPLVGLSLAELAEIRLTLKEGYFWTAMVSRHHSGVELQDTLHSKLDKFLTRFSGWRKLARQVSLSQCLEQVLADTYYADWLKTRPRGEQRAANLESFLQLAQQFDQFQRQGLFRFLKFIAAQRELETEPDVPAVVPEDCVRLMSIHQSKGLEFPVVVVGALDKKFNEQDLRGEIILDERLGLCPRVKPPQTGRRYPSLPHWLAQKNQKRELRGEELRLLYVAMTRARDTLVLSSGVSEKKWESLWTKSEPVTASKIADAGSLADWLGLWFAQNVNSYETVAREGRSQDLCWRFVPDEDLVNREEKIHGEPTAENSRDGSLEQPPHPLESLDDATTERLRAVLSWQYPQEAATRRAAKSSVTELRRAAEEADAEAEQPFAVSVFPTSPPRRTRNPEPGTRKLNASEIGAAHHKFLQHVSLANTGDLTAEAERLVREEFLTADERAVLDLEALAQFWESELGQKICAQPLDSVKRELPFTARFSPAELAAVTGRPTEETLADEFIVVQGVADLAVLLPGEIWLVDFKTDEVRDEELAVKKRIYEPQLQLYSAALEKIFSRKVTVRALHFLALRQTIEI
jgi:ATP-dependent helicase/nuclease subunit A